MALTFAFPCSFSAPLIVVSPAGSSMVVLGENFKPGWISVVVEPDGAQIRTSDINLSSSAFAKEATIGPYKQASLF
jgi:hypothetical protein